MSGGHIADSLFSLDHKFHCLEIMFFFHQKPTKAALESCKHKGGEKWLYIFSHFFVSCIAKATWNVFCLLFLFLWNKVYCLWIALSWQLLRPKAYFTDAEWTSTRSGFVGNFPTMLKTLCLSPHLVGGQFRSCGVFRLWHQLSTAWLSIDKVTSWLVLICLEI